MERLPPPPEVLPTPRDSDLSILPSGTPLWRVHPRGGPHPAAWNGFRHFGPLATARFDPHLGPPRLQERGVLYGAIGRTAGLTCLAEAFQDTRTLDPVCRRPWLACVPVQDEVRLLDLTSGWTTRAGGSQAICSGDREMSRRWSRAIYESFPGIHGLLYASSTYGPGRALALYERSAPALARHPRFHRPLDDPDLRGFLERAAWELGYDLV